MIPFLDVASMNHEVAAELEDAYRRVISGGQYILGPELEAFEHQLARVEGVEYAVGVGSGLDALVLVLAASGIGPGDEVIVPAHTFIATWLAVSRVGATPVPVEPRENTYNMDPERIEDAITSRTVAVIPVHLYGQPAQITAIQEITSRHGLLLIADAAQSVGARYQGRPASSFGVAATLSFYPGKNLGAVGDGGAVLTSDSDLAQQIRRLRNYGSSAKYTHEELGFNSRLDELQAALLRVKLAKLPEWNKRRKKVAAAYDVGLSDTDLVQPTTIEEAEPVWHLYVVRTRRRREFMQYLLDRGIQTLIHYPIPPHRQQAYREFAGTHLPVTEQLAQEVLSLPMGPHLGEAQIEEVVTAVRGFTLR